MRTKSEILREIVSVARDLGRSPGARSFQARTGIADHEWRGKFFARWSDALSEAGVAPTSEFGTRNYEDEDLFMILARLVKEFQRFPTHSEVRLEHSRDPRVPMPRTFSSRLGRRSDQIASLYEWALEVDDPDLLDLLSRELESTSSDKSESSSLYTSVPGRVYLLQSGSRFKIGRSSNVENRIKQLQSGNPETIKLVHVLETDDPNGIEAYWHSRFSSKRISGEWFGLSDEDVQAFRSRGPRM